MRLAQKFGISALLGAALLFAACGDEGTDRFPGGSTFAGFRVLQSNPVVNDEFVPLHTQIEILVSEPVVSTSLAGNLLVFETLPGGANSDITSEGSISLQNAGRTIIFILNRPLVMDARYAVQLTSGIRSSAGNALDPYVIPFSTGALDGTGLGAIVVSGPPQVTDISIFQDFYQGPCLGFLVTFNEDLQSIPRVDARLCNDAFGIFGNGLETCGGVLPLIGVVFDPFNSRSFLYTFSDGGCFNCNLYATDTEIKLAVTEAFDFQGERLTRAYERSFRYTTNLFGGDYDRPPTCN